MKLAPLSRKLKAGDQVEIITARSASPKIEWLSFLTSRSARRKLMDYIRTNSPGKLTEAESLLQYKPEEISIHVTLKGVNRPGLTAEIESVLKKINGIDEVAISDSI